MPRYSTSSDQPSPTASRFELYVPFVVHVRIIPDLATGKRWSYYRNMEKIALRVEEQLKAAEDTAGFNIATPVAFTPQFGDYSARLTIVGFYEQSRLESGTTRNGRQNSPPTTNIDIIHSGTDPDEKTMVINGNRGGSLAAGQNPMAAIEQEVVELRDALVASTNQFTEDDILHIEYNGIKYGLKKIGGRSFRG